MQFRNHKRLNTRVEEHHQLLLDAFEWELNNVFHSRKKKLVKRWILLFFCV